MRYVIISLVILSLTGADAPCQWTKTSFADSVGVDALVSQGTNIFIAGGGGGFVPLPVVSGRGSIHDRVASSGAKHGYTYVESLASIDSLGTGVFMSSDSGSTWVSAGLRNTTVFAMAVLGKDLFAADYDKIFRTSDSGADWDTVGNLGGWLVTLDVDSVGRGKALVFASGGGGIFMSQDTGTSWTEMNVSFPGAGGGVTCLASDGPNLFAGTWDGPGPIDVTNFSGVFRSTDYGVHWNVVDSILTPLCLTVNGNVVLAGTEGGVYVSTDSGTTWSVVNQTMAFFSILFVGDNILSGTSKGIYRSLDNGKTWTPVNIAGDSSTAGMLSVTPTDVFAVSGIQHTDLPRLFMGPVNEVLRAPISGITAVIEPPRTVPLGYSLLQNYPDPFNPTTNIGYRLSAVSEVTVKVYDILGRAVETLVNGRQDAGSYSITFDGGRLPSGVYFYRLQAGDYSKVMKMILLK